MTSATRAAVVVGAHPVAELRVLVDLVGVTELAVPIVDEPVDRVHERPVERMTHGERLRREPAGARPGRPSGRRRRA